MINVKSKRTWASAVLSLSLIGCVSTGTPEGDMLVGAAVGAAATAVLGNAIKKDAVVERHVIESYPHYVRPPRPHRPYRPHRPSHRT